jgi:putative transposase
MTNHIHTIVVPQSADALASTFRDAHSKYGSWFNRKYELTGHLWQGRFYSCVLGEDHLWNAVRYVELNPVRAGIVSRAEDYRWSSARAHVQGTDDALLNRDLPLVKEIVDWSGWLAGGDVRTDSEAIRKATERDFPLGSDEFVARLELELGRCLRPQKRGPKPKEKK